MIEALVALAIIVAVLSSIGAVIASTVKGTRAIDTRLALGGVAETVLATLSSRDALKPGRQSGVLSGYRWQIDVTPMNTSVGPQVRFVPMAVDMRIQAAGGPTIRVTTVRLVRKVTE